MSSFAETWNRHNQNSIFRDSFDCNKVTLSCLKGSTMDSWVKQKFPKLLEIGISTFFFVFSGSKYRLSPRLGIVISKLVYLEISLTVTK